ncbi:hypothetical protein CE91St39_24970 [Desulfovibrionaceae bacterium]|uniref:Uncharacterized protein n=1 Tax=Desulfovibrio fairfieldensis TaxID=44742 RepID=A0A0X8JKX2_9BACT|nr:hypothetical protein AXF13_11310 [Desulfovibrio fairfieldensis]GKI13043.1 hypothetical protein CE91St39_24970 [Desulfovibrionaceae bacterium]
MRRPGLIRAVLRRLMNLRTLRRGPMGGRRMPVRRGRGPLAAGGQAEKGRDQQGRGTETQKMTQATHGGSSGNKKGLTFYGQTFLVQRKPTGKPGNPA